MKTFGTNLMDSNKQKKDDTLFKVSRDCTFCERTI